MARNKSKAKSMRRFGEAMTRSPKYARILEKRNYPPGKTKSHRRRAATSPYGAGLLEKQKLKAIYDIGETQMRRYFKQAARKTGGTGHNLIELLERRLDNIAYRLGFAPTIWAARQLVSHGHVFVNGERVNVRSYQVTPGETVTISARMKTNAAVQQSLELAKGGKLPDYLKFDAETRTGTLVRMPKRWEVPVNVKESAVVEFYARG
jgi:small subunit ribosomal protein S4